MFLQGYLQHVEGGDQPAYPEELTPREQEVLVLITDSLTNPEIAQHLDISVKTVDRHCENIMRKLELHSRIDLVKYALRRGLVRLDD